MGSWLGPWLGAADALGPSEGRTLGLLESAALGIAEVVGDADSTGVGPELGGEDGGAVGPVDASMTRYATHSEVTVARRRRPSSTRTTRSSSRTSLSSAIISSSVISSAYEIRPVVSRRSLSRTHRVRTTTLVLHIPTESRLPLMVPLYRRVSSPSSLASTASSLPSSRTRSPDGSSVTKITASITKVRPRPGFPRPLLARPVMAG